MYSQRPRLASELTQDDPHLVATPTPSPLKDPALETAPVGLACSLCPPSYLPNNYLLAMAM